MTLTQENHEKPGEVVIYLISPGFRPHIIHLLRVNDIKVVLKCFFSKIFYIKSFLPSVFLFPLFTLILVVLANQVKVWQLVEECREM